MNIKRTYATLGGVALIAAVTVALVFGVFGGQPAATTGEEAAFSSADGAQESIQVHGHWTIDVREPDGTLVSHHEFDNAFSAGQSADLVADVFSGNLTAGDWMIFLRAVPDEDSPWGSELGFICESTTAGYCPSMDPNVSCDLSVTSPSSAVLLAGTIDAEESGRIDIVGTMLWYCANTVSPASCSTGFELQTFTQTTITPVEVTAGQQIAVTVEIGFS